MECRIWVTVFLRTSFMEVFREIIPGFLGEEGGFYDFLFSGEWFHPDRQGLYFLKVIEKIYWDIKNHKILKNLYFNINFYRKRSFFIL